MSAGVEEPRGLGDARGGGTAEGDGGSKSDMPSLCSDVKEGIFKTSLRPGSGGSTSPRLPLLPPLCRVYGLDGVCTVSITATEASRVILGFLDKSFGAASGPFELRLRLGKPSPNGAAERERPIAGGVGSDSPGDGSRRGITDASSDCVN